MIFWIFVIALIVLIALFALNYNHWQNDGIDIGGGILIGILLVAIIIMTVGILINIADTPAQFEAKQQTYEALTYQYENAIFENKNAHCNSGLKSLYDQIKDYNEDVAYGKKVQRDFWIGIFVPNIYDDLKLIEYKEIKTNEN